MALGKAKVNITANLAPLKAGLMQAKSMVSSMVKSAGSVLKSGFSSAFSVIQSGLRKIMNLAKLTVAALLGIGAASVKIASDVQESDNLFRIAMGDMADEAARFAKEYSASLNLFENDTRKSLSTFQLMLTSMGIGSREAFEMSKGLTKLTNDIASFRNQKPEEIFLKLQAGITGEAEPLKRLGILVNDNVIKQLALEKGLLGTKKAMDAIPKSTSKVVNGVLQTTKKLKEEKKELTEAQKVMLRYQAIIKATEKDQGDMARTIDDTANVFRQINAQLKRSGGTIGDVLLPGLTKAAIAIRDWLVENQKQIQQWADKAVEWFGKVKDRIGEYIELAKKGKEAGNFKDLFSAISEDFKNIFDILKDAFERVKPIAIELGKAIGKGFWDSIKETRPARAIKDIGQRIASPVTLATGMSEMGYQRNLGNQLRIIRERNESMGVEMTGKELLNEARKQTQYMYEMARKVEMW